MLVLSLQRETVISGVQTLVMLIMHWKYNIASVPTPMGNMVQQQVAVQRIAVMEVFVAAPLIRLAFTERLCQQFKNQLLSALLPITWVALTIAQAFLLLTVRIALRLLDVYFIVAFLGKEWRECAAVTRGVLVALLFFL